MKILLLLLAVAAFTVNVALANMTSQTKPDAFGNGSITTFSDGSTARTTPDAFGNGTNTTFSNGSTAHTTLDAFGNGNNTTYSNGFIDPSHN